MNPALWLLVAIAGAAFLESVALLLLYHASERLRSHVSNAFIWCIHPFTGADGRPSWTKLVDLLVLGAYWAAAPIPQGVAYFIIASAHGTKVLLAVIEKTQIAASVTEALSRQFARNESRTETQGDTRAVNENINRMITETRGPTGEPMQSLPPRVGATTPSGEP